MGQCRAHTLGITRLPIEPAGPGVDVHARGRCHLRDGDWGTARGHIADGRVEVAWDQDCVLRQMELKPSGEVTLHRTMDNVYGTGRLGWCGLKGPVMPLPVMPLPVMPLPVRPNGAA